MTWGLLVVDFKLYVFGMTLGPKKIGRSCWEVQGHQIKLVYGCFGWEGNNLTGRNFDACMRWPACGTKNKIANGLPVLN